MSFRYNDPDSLQTLFDKHPDKIACVILEPEKDVPPKDNFLQKIRQLCTENDAVLVFDEMITGFRWALGGAQVVYDVKPDLSAFGKAIANGFALSALLGRKEIMDLGGIKHDKERVFLLSTTHGAENHALAAAHETLGVYQSENVIEYLDTQGTSLKRELESLISEFGIADHIRIVGKPCCLTFATLDQHSRPSQAFRTLMLQELIRNGIIAPSLVISFSHSDNDIASTLEAFRNAIVVYGKALESGVENFLIGQSVKPVYRTHN
jgi:glutamate-1-semialdehyde 2,1-aminomutase